MNINCTSIALIKIHEYIYIYICMQYKYSKYLGPSGPCSV